MTEHITPDEQQALADYVRQHPLHSDIDEKAFEEEYSGFYKGI
jgi:hypothetical protein